jgi:hypothetical protein
MHNVQPNPMQMWCGYSEGELQACKCDVIVRGQNTSAMLMQCKQEM